MIRPDSNHNKLEIGQEAIDLLKSLPGPLSIVASRSLNLLKYIYSLVVGPLHSGKSFLTNQLLGENSFELGHNVAPKTMVFYQKESEIS
jgi:hypothetical protein